MSEDKKKVSTSREGKAGVVNFSLTDPSRYRYTEEDFNTYNRLQPGRNYVTYGFDNLLPERIIELKEDSPTHAAILNKKAKYTAGSKLNLEKASEGFKAWQKKINNGKGLYNLLYRLALDLHLFGGFCTQVVPLAFSDKVDNIIYQDFSKVRRGFTKEDNGEVYEQQLLISPMWRKEYEFTPKRVDFYHGDKQFPQKGNDNGEIENVPAFLYHYVDSPGREWYPLPDWWAGYKNIATEVESNNYVYNQMKNSFNPSGFLNVPEGLTPDEQKKFKKQINEGLKGTDNAGQVITIFTEDGAKVTWTPLKDTLKQDGVLDIQERNQRMILTAHSVSSPLLVGLPSGPTLGSDAGTIKEAAKEFFNQVIQPYQTMLFDGINKLIRDAGFDYEIEVINDYVYLNEDNE